VTLNLKRTTIAAALAMLPTLYLTGACAAPPDPAPGAGQLLRELPPTLLPPTAPPDIHLIPVQPNNGDDSHMFHVDSIMVTGATLVDSSQIRAAVAGFEHTDMTLRKAMDIADSITAIYQKAGFPLARAIVPAQTLSGGMLKIDVIEARYGKATLNNNSRVGDRILQSTLASIESGQVVEQSQLDRTILLLSDVPGVKVDATLAPGAAVGTTDLDVTTTAASLVSGSGVLDDAGNRYTGRIRASANLAIASPLGIGDQVTANFLTSGNGLNDIALGYSAPIYDVSNRIGADYSALHYQLEDGLDRLDARGTASVADFWGAHAFIRGTTANLSGRLEFAHKQLDDTIGVADIRTNRHTDSIAATLSADVRDQFLGGGLNSIALTGTAGQLGFDSADAAALDAKTAKTAGGYGKVDLTLSRLQSIDTDTSLYLSFASQFASSNLDSSEQMIVGGPSSVRGYDVGSLSGDEGDFLTFELRRHLNLPVPGEWQAKTFVDIGYLKTNRNQWISGINSAHLSSVGFGLDWYGPEQWTGQLEVAKAVGGAPSLLGNLVPPVRVWLEVSKSF
jgi:hemolysin activation/secretion protein